MNKSDALNQISQMITDIVNCREKNLEEGYFQMATTCDAQETVLRKAMNIVNEIETNEWIPCSERLPVPENEDMIRTVIEVTMSYYNERNIYSTCAFYDYRKKKFLNVYTGNDITKNVSAWKPFDKPYKERD